MKILFESDRECTIDGVGLLEPGKPVEVDPVVWSNYHPNPPLDANLPKHIRVWVETEAEKKGKKKESSEEGGE